MSLGLSIFLPEVPDLCLCPTDTPLLDPTWYTNVIFFEMKMSKIKDDLRISSMKNFKRVNHWNVDSPALWWHCERFSALERGTRRLVVKAKKNKNSFNDVSAAFTLSSAVSFYCWSNLVTTETLLARTTVEKLRAVSKFPENVLQVHWTAKGNRILRNCGVNLMKLPVIVLRTLLLLSVN